MREYVRPMALVEEFVANSYVAKCQNSKSEGEKIGCINPYHLHHLWYEEFGSVWVEAAASTCSIIVTPDDEKTRGTNLAGNYYTEEGTYVYGLNGFKAQCDTYSDRYVRYLPSSVVAQGSASPCYGAYEYEGSYTASVFS